MSEVVSLNNGNYTSGMNASDYDLGYINGINKAKQLVQFLTTQHSNEPNILSALQEVTNILTAALNPPQQ